MITKHVCEICGAVVSDDFIVYDEELCTFFCRDDYDAVMQKWSINDDV